MSELLDEFIMITVSANVIFFKMFTHEKKELCLAALAVFYFIRKGLPGALFVLI